MRISDWSSDVCSSDLIGQRILGAALCRLVEIFLHRATIFGKRRLHRGDPQQVLGLKAVEHERLGHVRAFGDGTRRRDRKSVVEGKRVSVRVDLGGRRNIKNKKNKEI